MTSFITNKKNRAELMSSSTWLMKEHMFNSFDHVCWSIYETTKDKNLCINRCPLPQTHSEIFQILDQACPANVLIFECIKFDGLFELNVTELLCNEVFGSSVPRDCHSCLFLAIIFPEFCRLTHFRRKLDHSSLLRQYFDFT